MDVFGALVLIIVMYIVVPVAVCAATLIALGGAERLLPGAMRDRALARREDATDRH